MDVRSYDWSMSNYVPKRGRTPRQAKKPRRMGATGDDAPDAVAAACLRGLSAVFANPGAKPPTGASEEVALAAALDLEGSEDPEVAKAAKALSAALGGG